MLAIQIYPRKAWVVWISFFYVACHMLHIRPLIMEFLHSLPRRGASSLAGFLVPSGKSINCCLRCTFYVFCSLAIVLSSPSLVKLSTAHQATRSRPVATESSNIFARLFRSRRSTEILSVYLNLSYNSHPRETRECAATWPTTFPAVTICSTSYPSAAWIGIGSPTRLTLVEEGSGMRWHRAANPRLGGTSLRLG